jgi:hypothetical protein
LSKPFYRRLFSSRATLAALTVTVVVLLTAFESFPQQPDSTWRPQGYTITIPWHGAPSETAERATAASTTIPLWSYSVVSPVDGHTYNGKMVGRSPFFHGARTTNVPTVIVPIILNMPDGGVFDPTVTHPCAPAGVPLTLVQGSPILNPFDFNWGGTDIGSGQYIDDYQRANFSTNVSVTGTRYHTTLSPVTTTAPVTIDVPAGKGQTYDATTFGGCGQLGVIDINWFGPYAENTLIPTTLSGIAAPTNFPILLMHNVVQAQGGTNIFVNCCILGFHDAFGVPMQTFTPSDFDTSGVFSHVSDVSVLSHEVGEWLDDPSGGNPTPLWGHIGQVGGCQGNLENGDPLSGTLLPGVMMPNGVTYNLQELAFFSWFFRQVPSLGVNGWFSNNGTFMSGAGAVCS